MLTSLFCLRAYITYSKRTVKYHYTIVDRTAERAGEVQKAVHFAHRFLT